VVVFVRRDIRSIDKRNRDGMAATIAVATASTATVLPMRQRREQIAEGSKWASKFHDNSYK